MIKSQISYDSRILNCRFLCKTRRAFARGTIERGLKELRSGLFRFVRSWHIATFRCAVKFGRCRGIADIDQAASSIYEDVPWLPGKVSDLLRDAMNCFASLAMTGKAKPHFAAR